jgi:hypothetical protein
MITPLAIARLIVEPMLAMAARPFAAIGAGSCLRFAGVLENPD